MRVLMLLAALAASVAFAAEEMTPEHRAAVEAFTAAQDLEGMSQDFFRQIARDTPARIGRAVDALVDKRTDLAPEQKASAKAAVASLSREMTQDMTREYAQLDLKAIAHDIAYDVYAPQFTTAELQELTAFYTTPTGKKMLDAGSEMAMAIAQHLPNVDPFGPEEKREIARFNETPAARHVLQPDVQRQVDAVLEKHLAPGRNRILDKYRPLFRAAVPAPAGAGGR